jgi:hypothetical protein
MSKTKRLRKKKPNTDKLDRSQPAVTDPAPVAPVVDSPAEVTHTRAQADGVRSIER